MPRRHAWRCALRPARRAGPASMAIRAASFHHFDRLIGKETFTSGSARTGSSKSAPSPSSLVAAHLRSRAPGPSRREALAQGDDALRDPGVTTGFTAGDVDRPERSRAWSRPPRSAVFSPGSGRPLAAASGVGRRRVVVARDLRRRRRSPSGFQRKARGIMGRASTYRVGRLVSVHGGRGAAGAVQRRRGDASLDRSSATRSQPARTSALAEWVAAVVPRQRRRSRLPLGVRRARRAAEGRRALARDQVIFAPSASRGSCGGLLTFGELGQRPWCDDAQRAVRPEHERRRRRCGTAAPESFRGGGRSGSRRWCGRVRARRALDRSRR